MKDNLVEVLSDSSDFSNVSLLVLDPDIKLKHNRFKIKENKSAFVGVPKNKKSGNDEYWHLKLTPKNKKGYKYAELVVDGDGMPFRAKIVEQNDDSTSVRLSRIKKNVNLSADVFNLTLPSGTKIIKG